MKKKKKNLEQYQALNTHSIKVYATTITTIIINIDSLKAILPDFWYQSK